MITYIQQVARDIAVSFRGPNALWTGLGFFGQIVFTMRFVVQWIASEKQGKSVIPIHFWFISIAGSVVLLVYSFWKRDPVFILGQSFGCFVYVRNLMLLSKEKQAAEG